jgi:hypothetical protein
MISKGSSNAGLSTVQDKTLLGQMVLEQEDALKIKTVEEKIILLLDFEFFIGVSAVQVNTETDSKSKSEITQ